MVRWNEKREEKKKEREVGKTGEERREGGMIRVVKTLFRRALRWQVKWQLP